MNHIIAEEIPTELWQQIARLSSSASQTNLVLTSSHFLSLVRPILYHSLLLRNTPSWLDYTYDLLSRDEGLVVYVQHLHIKIDGFLDVPFFPCLSLVAAMKNLKSLTMEGCPFAKSGEQAQFALLLNNSTPLLKSLRFIGQVQNWQDTDNSFPVNGIEYVSWKGNGSFASSFILDVANWSLSTIQSIDFSPLSTMRHDQVILQLFLALQFPRLRSLTLGGYTANYQNDLIDAAVASFLYAHPTLENVSFPCPMGFSGISINSNPSYTGILPNLKVFHGSARNITTLVKLMSDGVNSLEKISVEAFPYLEMKHMLYVLKTNGGLLNVTSVELCHLNVQICVMVSWIQQMQEICPSLRFWTGLIPASMAPDDFSALFSHFTTALRIDIPSRLFNQRIGGVDRASLYEIFGNTQTLRVVSNEPERCTIWFKLDEEWTRIARSLSGSKRYLIIPRAID